MACSTTSFPWPRICLAKAWEVLSFGGSVSSEGEESLTAADPGILENGPALTKSWRRYTREHAVTPPARAPPRSSPTFGPMGLMPCAWKLEHQRGNEPGCAAPLHAKQIQEGPDL